MTDPWLFMLAVLALLVTPGPTNTLLAAAGALVGPRAALRLIPAELAGYLLAILTLVGVAGPTVAETPLLGIALRAAAAVWLALSAIRLWREAGDGFTGAPQPITPARVFLTTLLNPKTLVFAFVVFPADGLARAVPLFAALVVGVAGLWILAGAAVTAAGRGSIGRQHVSRAAAVILALFATLLAGSAFAAAF